MSRNMPPWLATFCWIASLLIYGNVDDVKTTTTAMWRAMELASEGEGSAKLFLTIERIQRHIRETLQVITREILHERRSGMLDYSFDQILAATERHVTHDSKGVDMVWWSRWCEFKIIASSRICCFHYFLSCEENASKRKRTGAHETQQCWRLFNVAQCFSSFGSSGARVRMFRFDVLMLWSDQLEAELDIAQCAVPYVDIFLLFSFLLLYGVVVASRPPHWKRRELKTFFFLLWMREKDTVDIFLDI